LKYLKILYYIGCNKHPCYIHSFAFMIGANNLIPMEIALKIANKIKQKERFCVYIVIPMWPEGVPSSTATQRILFWQVSFLCHLKKWGQIIKISSPKT